jgi:hypothetical protein
MKINTFILIVGFYGMLTLMSCGNNSFKGFNKGDTSDSIKNMKFEIIITNYYLGGIMHQTTVSQDSLMVKRYIMTGKRYSESRLLTSKETEMMQQFLADFPLVKLNKQYVTETVQDGTVIDFSISIGNKHRDIHIANKYQKDLGDLVKTVEKLLKEEQYIGYSPESVPY